jgi:hypothetical protein
VFQGASGFSSAYIKVKLVLAACLEAGIAPGIFFYWDIFCTDVEAFVAANSSTGVQVQPRYN